MILQLSRMDAGIREQFVHGNPFCRQLGRERGQPQKTLRRSVEIRIQGRNYFRWSHDTSHSSMRICSHNFQVPVEGALAHFDAAIGMV